MSRSKNYSRTKGHAYETQICKELRDLGYDAVTSRSESKNMDDAKIDIVSKDLPCYVQLKKTQNTPNYSEIEKACKYKDKPFVIFHAKQKKKEKNICTESEYVMVPKEFFYQLIKKN